jgi:hypothetical protein
VDFPKIFIWPAVTLSVRKRSHEHAGAVGSDFELRT